MSDLDARLKGWTSATDGHVVRRITIDDVDLLADFYLKHRQPEYDVPDGRAMLGIVLDAAADIARKLHSRGDVAGANALSVLITTLQAAAPMLLGDVDADEIMVVALIWDHPLPTPATNPAIILEKDER